MKDIEKIRLSATARDITNDDDSPMIQGCHYDFPTCQKKFSTTMNTLVKVDNKYYNLNVLTTATLEPLE